MSRKLDKQEKYYFLDGRKQQVFRIVHFPLSAAQRPPGFRKAAVFSMRIKAFFKESRHLSGILQDRLPNPIYYLYFLSAEYQDSIFRKSGALCAVISQYFSIARFFTGSRQC